MVRYGGRSTGSRFFDGTATPGIDPRSLRDALPLADGGEEGLEAYRLGGDRARLRMPRMQVEHGGAGLGRLDGRPGDVLGGPLRRRHLVQQGLALVIVVAVDEGDVDALSASNVRTCNSGTTGTRYHHVSPGIHSSSAACRPAGLRSVAWCVCARGSSVR